MRKFIFPLSIIILSALIIFGPIPRTVHAQAQACSNAFGQPIPCPNTGGSKPGPKNRPTPITVTRPTATNTSHPCLPNNGSGAFPHINCTPSPCPQNNGSAAFPHINCTPSPCPENNGSGAFPKSCTPRPCPPNNGSGDTQNLCTPTPQAISGSGGQGNDPSSSATPTGLPGPLGMIIAVLIIVVCIIGGLIIVVRRGLVGSFADGSVRNADPWDQFVKMNGNANQFDKIMDSTNQFMKENPSGQFMKENPSDQFKKYDPDTKGFEE